MVPYVTVKMSKVFDINEEFIRSKMGINASLFFPVSKAKRARVDWNAICWSF